MKTLVKKGSHTFREVETDDVPSSLDPAITANSRSNMDDRPLAAIDGEIETVEYEPETKERRRRSRKLKEVSMADKPAAPPAPAPPSVPPSTLPGDTMPGGTGDIDSGG